MNFKMILLGAAALCIATGASAQTINANQTGLGSNSSDNVLVSGNNNGGAGGTAVTGSISNDNRSSGGSATGIGGIGNQFGGNATAIGGPNTALGGSSAVVGSGNSAQGQGQSQDASNSQGQSQSSNLTNANNLSQGNSQSVGGQTASQTNGQSVTFNEAVQRREVASAHAPVVVNVASCALGGSLAAQGPGFGVALGGAKIDAACDRRQTAQVLFQLGEKEVALQYLAAGDAKVSEAMTLVRSRK